MVFSSLVARPTILQWTRCFYLNLKNGNDQVIGLNLEREKMAGENSSPVVQKLQVK